ncbi:MAG: Methyltransferase FkbM [Hyphomicrobiales bacterium]|jgi:FkbM family methyltransferase|nr:Methyltransferase FkbM [Hyphomicrobiales bacterium]
MTMALRNLKRMSGEVVGVVRHASRRDALRWLRAFVLHLPTIMRSRSLQGADAAWANGGVFRPSNGVAVKLPAGFTMGAREMYCRDVYLRSGLTMPSSGWVVDLGANHGLFSVWAAVSGATAVAVEAQQGFADVIRTVVAANGVEERVRIVTAIAGSSAPSVPTRGVLADEERWVTATHSVGQRPNVVAMGDLLDSLGADRVGLLKVDIEGGEFAVFDPLGDLEWLARVEQIALEVHPPFGDVPALERLLVDRGFSVTFQANEPVEVAPADPSVNYAYATRVRT